MVDNLHVKREGNISEILAKVHGEWQNIYVCEAVQGSVWDPQRRHCFSVKHSQKNCSGGNSKSTLMNCVLLTR